MLYALSDEFHQTFVPGRVADPWDLFCDALGAVVMLLAFAWLWRGREAPPHRFGLSGAVQAQGSGPSCGRAQGTPQSPPQGRGEAGWQEGGRKD